MSPSSPPRISILVPLYNGIEFLEECISSVVAQTFTDWELWVGINGHDSPEGKVTQEAFRICTAFGPTSSPLGCSNDPMKGLHSVDPRIKVVFQTVKGKVASLTDLLENFATAEWICILDCDDKWTPDKLAKQWEAKSGPAKNAAVIGTWCHYFGNRVGPCANFPSGYIDPVLFQKGNPVINSSTMMHRSWARWRYPAQVFTISCEDYDQWLRVILAGGRIYNIPEHLTFHRLHSASAFNTKPLDDRLLRECFVNAQKTGAGWWEEGNISMPSFWDNMGVLMTKLQLVKIRFSRSILPNEIDLLCFLAKQNEYAITEWNSQDIVLERGGLLFELYRTPDLVLNFANKLRFASKWTEALYFIKILLQMERETPREIMEYERYHVAGIIGWYAQDHTFGKEAVLKAIEARDRNIDKENLKFY
jgi:glycosyltransferase involved in cell wall biosynthesis